MLSQAEPVDDMIRVGKQFALRGEGLAEPVGYERGAVETGGNIHLAPGYELACRVPPSSELRSSKTKSSHRFFCNRMADSSPENPVPMITVSTCRGCIDIATILAHTSFRNGARWH